jgi:hypothetical protein
MRLVLAAAALMAAFAVSTAPSAQTTPPFGGTIFLDPDIVLPTDPTVFGSATYTGRGMRTVYDRRAVAFIQINAYLFNLAYSDGTTIEAQVNPEFGSEAAARVEAETYGRYVGQLARALRRDIDALWIHRGVQPFGGGNRSILIHTGQSALYIQDGILEETLIHEAAHTSLDADHALSAGWVAAQNADPTFISTYARDNPQREDIAESVLPYLAATYRRARISQQLFDTITTTIPNRNAYFAAQGFDLRPFFDPTVSTDTPPVASALRLTVAPNPASASPTIRLALDSPRTVRIEVMDALGRTVATVASGAFPAGESVIHWDGPRLAPGVYLCRALTADAVAMSLVTISR